MRKILTSKEELIEFIKTRERASVKGSTTSDGYIYHEIPFPGYEELDVHRKDSATRVTSIQENLDLKGLRVLDIGCNNGYFCFEMARLGAKECLGVDYDKNALVIADSLKHIHQIENVHFINRKFTTQFPAYINETYGAFDVIILNSILHWLIYANFTYDRVVNLLNQLETHGKQIIIYEPSSSCTAYYPELLRKKNTAKFFSDLGALKYKKIGESEAANVKDTRQIWLGEKHIDTHAARINDFLKSTPQAAPGDGFDEYTVHHVNREKICFLGPDYFVKTTTKPDSLFRMFLENEYRHAILLNECTFNTTILVSRTDIGDRLFLFYKPMRHKSIEDIYLLKSEVDWIGKELFTFMNTLRTYGLVHNDLKPQNILVDKKKRTLKIIDYEFCGTGRNYNADNVDEWLPFATNSPEEKTLVTKLMGLVGGIYRSPFGVGCFENDLYAVNTVLFQLKNRKQYRRMWSGHVKKKIKAIIKYILGHVFFVPRYKNT